MRRWTIRLTTENEEEFRCLHDDTTMTNNLWCCNERFRNKRFRDERFGHCVVTMDESRDFCMTIDEWSFEIYIESSDYQRHGREREKRARERRVKLMEAREETNAYRSSLEHVTRKDESRDYKEMRICIGSFDDDDESKWPEDDWMKTRSNETMAY